MKMFLINCVVLSLACALASLLPCKAKILGGDFYVHVFIGMASAAFLPEIAKLLT